jgi:RNA polymerase sigma-70 factor (ECF subfamily)
LHEEDLEDFVQDALLRILDNLGSFRGESRFLTWAQKIAVRVAYSELRRTRWQNISLQDLAIPTETGVIPPSWVDESAGPEKQALQQQALDTLKRVIAQELTEKQRNALVATRICGMPIEEVARRMDTNRNALYKLLHDARVRLKQRLQEAGISSQEMLHLFTQDKPDRQEYEATR